MRIRTVGLGVLALLVTATGVHAATSEQIEDARTRALAWLLLESVDSHARAVRGLHAAGLDGSASAQRLAKPLGDGDRDSIPESVEAIFGTDVLADDSRFLERGNGRYGTSLVPMRAVAGPPGLTLVVGGDGFTPAPGGGATSPLTLTVVNPIPVMAALTPATVVAGLADDIATAGTATITASTSPTGVTAGITVTVNGNAFVSSSVVRWNGVGQATTAARRCAGTLPSHRVKRRAHRRPHSLRAPLIA
jgi:hypothetical protein